MSDKKCDWYCRNCGYLSGQRVAYHETCDTCHQPVEVHDANEASALATALAENRRLREALEEAAKSLQTIASQAGRDEMMKDMMDVRGYADSRARVARAALTPPAKEVPSE